MKTVNVFNTGPCHNRKWKECDRPGECNPEIRMLLTMTDVLKSCAVVIFYMMGS